MTKKKKKILVIGKPIEELTEKEVDELLMELQVKKLEYEYEIEEHSQDTRTYTVESNKKLPQEVVERVYFSSVGLNDSDVGVKHDITEEVYEALEYEGYDKDHEDFKELKATVQYTGTGFGDNTQIDSSGDFFKLENA